MENLIIVGTGINAKKALLFINRYNLFNVIGFAVNSKYYKDSKFCDLPVYKLENIKNEVTCSFKIFIAILWNRLNKDRRTLFEYCKSMGFSFANLISPTSIIYDSVEIGHNCYIDDMCCVQNNVKIKDNVFIRAMCFIGSNARINEHTFIAAHSTVGGSVSIGTQTFIGFNSVLLDGVVIGDKCIVGAGTVIKRNLPSYSKCIVSVDNYLVRQYDPDIIEEKLLFAKNVR